MHLRGRAAHCTGLVVKCRFLLVIRIWETSTKITSGVLAADRGVGGAFASDSQMCYSTTVLLSILSISKYMQKPCGP